MPDKRAAIESMIAKLQEERDALRVKAHLGGMEAKEEYERISARVDELMKQFEPFTDAVGETAGNVFAALGMAGEELLRGFGRVRNAARGKDES